MKQLPKSVGAGNPHATFCGNRGRATASGDPVGVETEVMDELLGTAGRKGRKQIRSAYNQRVTSRLYPSGRQNRVETDVLGPKGTIGSDPLPPPTSPVSCSSRRAVGGMPCRGPRAQNDKEGSYLKAGRITLPEDCHGMISLRSRLRARPRRPARGARRNKPPAGWR